MSSANPENAAKAALSVGAHAANSNAEAVQGADVVIIAVPYDKLGEVFRGLGSSVDDKVVIDATNHVNTQNPERCSGPLPMRRRSRNATRRFAWSRPSTTPLPRAWPIRPWMAFASTDSWPATTRTPRTRP